MLTNLNFVIPVFVKFGVSFHRRVYTLGGGVRLAEHQALPAHLPEGRERLGQRQVYVSMAEATLDAFFQQLNHIHACCAAHDGNGRLSRLRNIEEVVQEGLARVSGKHVELVNDEEDRLRGDAVILARYLGWV